MKIETNKEPKVELYEQSMYENTYRSKCFLVNTKHEGWKLAYFYKYEYLEDGEKQMFSDWKCMEYGNTLFISEYYDCLPIEIQEEE